MTFRGIMTFYKKGFHILDVTYGILFSGSQKFLFVVGGWNNSLYSSQKILEVAYDYRICKRFPKGGAPKYVEYQY